jgi:hypothetical protein
MPWTACITATTPKSAKNIVLAASDGVYPYTVADTGHSGDTWVQFI